MEMPNIDRSQGKAETLGVAEDKVSLVQKVCKLNYRIGKPPAFSDEHRVG